MKATTRASSPRTCAVLAELPRPKPVTSSKKFAPSPIRGRLDLLNRGQRWVIRKIEENSATVRDAHLGAFLAVMAEGHRVNIGALEDALKKGLA